MTPRRRSAQGSSLPPNTYRNPSGGHVYYRWENPATRQKVSLGRDLEAAKARAEQLNAELASTFGSLTRREMNVRGGDLNCAIVLDRWWDEFVPRQDWSPRYLDEMRILKSRYARLWGKYKFLGITRTVLQAHWAKIGPHAWQRHRQFWIHVFQFARSQWRQIETNEAEMTLRAPAADMKRKRQRHTLEGYEAIRKAAPRDLQVAMDLALYSLQRREDLVRLTRNDVIRDQEPWVLQVSPSKSARRGVHLRLKAPRGSKLRAALEAALALPAELGVMSPALLAHKPIRRTHGAGKTSVYQWSAQSLTKAFAAARDASGAYNELPSDEQPTLHQLRALGSWLYREAGYPEDHVQAILGHASVAMTEAYQSDHSVAWQDVEAGL